MFDKAYKIVAKFEGHYVNDPDDPGGPTNVGVTQATYNRYRKLWQLSPQSVRYITENEVRKIYESYWITSKANKFADSHPLTGTVHFDFAINAGFKQAAKTLQRTLGLKLIDGIIGNGTLSAIKLSSDGFLALDYLYAREDFYKDLCIRKPKFKKFLKGWLWRTKRLKEILDDWPTSCK